MKYPKTAALIKSARRRKGISQENSARAIGCSRLQWINWERGAHRPVLLAAKLAAFLEVDENELLSADDDEEEDSMQPLAREFGTMFATLVDRAVDARLAARDRSEAAA